MTDILKTRYHIGGRVEKEETMKKNGLKLRIFYIITGVTLCASVLSACGAASSGSNKAKSGAAYDTADYYDEPMAEAADYADDNMAMYDESASSGASSTTTTENASTSNRKLIRNASLSVETKEFDALLANLDEKIKSMGGYVENMSGYYGSKYESYRSNKTANITARIPAAKLDEFIGVVGEQANITNKSESVTDVTLDYVDMESHKKMLIEEQNRLLEFLDKAETVDEIISLEDRLTQVKYQLESMESQLRTYDNKVDYSTVNIDIREVVDYTPVVEEEEKTPVERMTEGFKNSLKTIGVGLREFGIWFVINLPYLLLLAIIAVIAIVIILKVNKKNVQKREAARAAFMEKTRANGDSKAKVCGNGAADKTDAKTDSKADADSKAGAENSEGSDPSGIYVEKPEKMN